MVKLSEVRHSSLDLPYGRQISKEHYGIVAQVKLLTIMLEMISSLIDDDNFLLATQLFIFSRHISTGLKLDANKEIMNKFPVAKKQWDLLAPYSGTIKQKSLQMLEKENISIDCAAKCLASITLLNNNQMDTLLNTFIKTRIKTFLKSIDLNQNLTNVRESLFTSVKILYDAVETIYECFISSGENDNGLLLRELQSMCNVTTISYVRHRSAGIFQKLPEIILKYKPQTQLQPIQQKSLDDAISMWLQTIEQISKNQLKSHITYIGSIKTVQDIQHLIKTKIEKPTNWTSICRKFFDSENFDFYLQFYQPLMHDRIRTIINISWTNILSEFHGEVGKIIEENDHIKRYVWNEDVLDIPVSLHAATSLNKRSHKLLMKLNAYNISIVVLCNKIDGHLELLFNELKQYLCDSSNVIELKKMNRDESDINHHELVRFLAECSRDNIKSLISIIKSYIPLSSSYTASESCIVMARLLQSIAEICPNLQNCFLGHLLIESPSLMRDPTQNTKGDQEWNTTCNLILEESSNFWKLWISSFVNNYKPLESKFDHFFILKDFPCWEKVIITEKNENEEAIDSAIFIPVGLSISIQIWIFNIINSLNCIIPHTLPKSIHLLLVNHLVTELYEYYKELTRNDFVTANQKVAWQFLFDLKVLSLLFVGRENKTMNEKYQQLIGHFRGIIDPFDYDVFYKHVSVNIKRCVAKLQYATGILVPNMEFLSSILGNQYSQAHEKNPNILLMNATSSENNWFKLLPIINVKDAMSQDMFQNKQKVSVHYFFNNKKVLN